MPGKIEWISYRGKEILMNNRSGLRDKEIIQNVDQSVETILNCGKKDILYLVDNSNTIIIPEVKEHIKKAGKTIHPYVKKTAVVGANKAQSILLSVLSNLTGMSIKVFEEADRAKEWLVK